MASLTWPFYILCDCSMSMWSKDGNTAQTPYEAMLDSTSALLELPEQNQSVAQIARLGILTFSDEAQVALPLTDMSTEYSIHDFTKGTFTNFASAFTLLRDVIHHDCHFLAQNGYSLRKPVVFLVTDGEPTVQDGTSHHGRYQTEAEWKPALDALHDLHVPDGKDGVHDLAIVAMGFSGSREDTLQMVAKGPGVACIAEPGIAQPNELMQSLLRSIIRSISASSRRGVFEFNAPRGFKILNDCSV